jgi:hypothetical protein
MRMSCLSVCVISKITCAHIYLVLNLHTLKIYEADICIFTISHTQTHICIVNFNRAVLIIVFVSHCVVVLQWDRKMSVISGSGRCRWFSWYISIHCKFYQKLSKLTACGFGGLGVACWPLVPKFAGSNPAEAVGFLSAKKILSTLSFGGEVKPSVPCRTFAACKTSLNVTWKSAFRQNYRITFSPIKFHLSLHGSLASRRTWRHQAATVATSKTGGAG